MTQPNNDMARVTARYIELKEESLYLADETLLDEVQWQLGAKMFLTEKGGNAAIPLGVIGQIAADDFYAGKIGGFHSNNLKSQTAQKFVSAARSNFVLIPPQSSDLPLGVVDDWRGIMENMDKLSKSVPDGIDGDCIGLFKGKGIRIMYDLIEPLPKKTGTTGSPDGEDLSDGCHINNYAAKANSHDEQEQAFARKLYEIRDSYYINMPEIYGIDDKKMTPGQWNEDLKGAVVLAFITLECNKSGAGDKKPEEQKKKATYFSPRLFQMTVLKRPIKAQADQSLKRKGAAFKGAPSPKKTRGAGGSGAN